LLHNKKRSWTKTGMPYAAALVHERFLERFDIENISIFRENPHREIIARRIYFAVKR